MSDESLLDELVLRHEELHEAGMPAKAEELCRDCPHLLSELRRRITALEAVDRQLKKHAAPPRGVTPPAAAIRLNCPHCHNPIELVADVKDDEVVCPSCGSSFHLDAERTRTWSQDKLPKLGRFELLSRVGVGGFGTVYKAFDSELKRTVALKLPRSGSLADPEDENRFLREARNAAQLRHSGIVPVFEVGRSEQFPYIVSELVDGVTLADALTGRRFSLREAARLVHRLADALDYSHKQGVVHRDLKPSNIMLGADDAPRIMDFGLAKRDAGEITMTMDGQVLGTPAYMSPEQAAGKAHEVDGRTDVYSLGVILYELSTGELPFHGNQRMLLHQVLHDEPRTLRSLNDRVPRDLETICLKAMAKEPNRRYQTAGELAGELHRYLSGEPIQARPIGSASRFWRWYSRHKTLVAGAYTLCTACFGVIVSLSSFIHFSSFTWLEVARDFIGLLFAFVLHALLFGIGVLSIRLRKAGVAVAAAYFGIMATVSLVALPMSYSLVDATPQDDAISIILRTNATAVGAWYSAGFVLQVLALMNSGYEPNLDQRS